MKQKLYLAVFAFLMLVFVLAMSPLALFAQQTKAVQKLSAGGTNSITEHLNFPAGKNLSVNGGLSGTPTGGDLNLSNLNVTLAAGVGADGKLLSGAGAPSDAVGINGDTYLRTSNGAFYLKAAGTWGSPVATLAPAGSTLAAYGIGDGVATGGSYADPAWITSLNKSKVGLGNVDNTSDVAKPVSTAQSTAISAAQAAAIQRANHTGTQAIDTVSGLQDALDDKAPEAPEGSSYALAGTIGALESNALQLSSTVGTKKTVAWSTSQELTFTGGLNQPGDSVEVVATVTSVPITLTVTPTNATVKRNGSLAALGATPITIIEAGTYRFFFQTFDDGTNLALEDTVYIAADIKLEDTGDYFTTNNVEVALQQIGEQITAAGDGDKGDLTISGGGAVHTIKSADTTTAGKVRLATDGETSASTAVQGNDSRLAEAKESIWTVVVGDQSATITTGTAKETFRAPHAATILDIRAELKTASSSGAPVIDINEDGTSILSTKLSIDQSEKTSVTAATARVVSDPNIADDAELTFDIDTAGTGAAGLKVKIFVNSYSTPGDPPPTELTLWDNTVHIVAQGQSNMLQRNSGATFSASSRIKIWNRTAGALQTWNPAGSPQHDFPYGEGGTGPNAGPFPLAWHVAKWIIDNTDLNVNIVMVARGEREIEDFASGLGLHTELLSQLQASGAYLPRIDIMLWHQGESDTDDISNYFATQFPAHQTLIRGLTKAHANLPWIAGELASSSGNAGKIAWNDAFATYATSATNTAIASADGLATDDGTHFEGPDGGVLGTRMGALIPNYYSVINAAAVGTAPTAPATSFTATAASESQINLAWTDSVDASVRGYIVNMDGAERTRVTTGVGSYAVTGLAAATEYDFQLVAVNAYGTNATSVVSETTDAAAPVVLDETNLFSDWSAEAGAYTDAGVTLATNGQTVRQWNDQEGNEGVSFKNLTQSTSGSRPTFTTNVWGSFPGLQFSTDDNMTVGSTVFTGEPFTIVVVGIADSVASTPYLASAVATANNQNYFALGLSSSHAALATVRGGTTIYSSTSSTTGSTGTPFVLVWSCASESDSKVSFNGSGEVNGAWTAVGPTVTNFSVGALMRSTPTGYFNGKILRVLVFDSALDATRRANAVAWARYYYGF